MKLIFSFIILLSLFAVASEEPTEKGLVPEIRLNSDKEEINQKKAMHTEVLISKTENEALNTLQKIIQKRKGHADEPSLWYRMAELYMRRAKSGRFFDLYRDSLNKFTTVPPQIKEQSAAKALKEAIRIYDKIEKEWPKYEEMDAVLFNNAFANQQIGKQQLAEEKYLKLINQYSNSPLIADAELSVGEMNYDAHRFNIALQHFEKIQNFKSARVYSYGLYKTAWTLYNLKQNEKAIEQLTLVINYFHPSNREQFKTTHNLREEAIRDMALFFEDVHTADKAYTFFSSFCLEGELGDALINLAKLYQSHNRDKDLQPFLNDFIEHAPLHAHRLQAELILIDSYETVKNRKQVLSHLDITASLCAIDSEYRKKNQTLAEQKCEIDFARTNLELAKKWWDLLQKNKQNTEIAELTLKAFEIRLRSDDTKKPDFRSRYAYAELLFQLNNFAKASEQYEKVSDVALDTTIMHDASYSAIVAMEKFKDHNQDTLLRLAEKYLAKNPEGKHKFQVKFKIGFIYYEKKLLQDSEKWLKPLAFDAQAQEFKRKSEDLILDIYNQNKDFTQIKQLCQKLLNEKIDGKRKSELEKILQESEFASIQEFAKTGDKNTAAEKLYAYANEYSSSNFAQEALWQSVSLQYNLGNTFNAAQVATEYYKKYPSDPRNKESLKEAAKSYTQLGLFNYAIDTFSILEKISTNKEKDELLEAQADMYLLSNKDSEARKILSRLATTQTKDRQAKIYAQIFATFKDKQFGSEYNLYEKKIIEAEIEPYYSFILLKNVEGLLENKKWTECFNATKEIINGSGSSEAKARAYQARGQVLEQEFSSQSMKTSLEKINVVLALKTEKLDKVNSAYSTAAKLAETSETQIAAFQGLHRIYQDYITNVENPILKTELNAEEKSVLNSELKKLTSPIYDKLKEVDAKISALGNLPKKEKNKTRSYASVQMSETIKPEISIADAGYNSFLPQDLDHVKDVSRFEDEKAKCQISTSDIKEANLKKLVKYANQCISAKNFDKAEKITEQMAKISSSTLHAPLYFSILALEKSEFAKAEFLLDILNKKFPSHPAIIANFAVAKLQLGKLPQAKDLFAEQESLQPQYFEAKVFSALDRYAKGDCLTFLEKVSNFSSSQIRQSKLTLIMSECLAIKGDLDKSVSVLQKELNENNKQPDLWLELARIHEAFKFEKKAAIDAYENAAKYSDQVKLKNWIRHKLEYLNAGEGKKVSLLEEQQ